MNFRYGRLIKMLAILVFMVLVSIGQMNDNFHLQLFRKVVGGIGVFAWLFVCEYISNFFFDSVNDMKDRWKTQVCRLISYISYASMACYMFHRLFFWMGEQVWNPSEAWAWLYMGGLVFPVMLVLSFYIQKGYDMMIKKIG